MLGIRGLLRSFKSNRDGGARNQTIELAKEPARVDEPSDQMVRKLEEKIQEVAHFANAAKNSAWYPIDEHQIATTIYSGQIIVVDRRDISIAPHLILRGLWEFEFGQFFRSLVRDGDVVFDIGANVGYFGLLASTENGEGDVHFFEANGELCKCLQRTIWLNGLQRRAYVTEAVVTDGESRTAEFYFIKDLWGSAGVYEVAGKGFTIGVETEQKKTLPATSIDAYCRDRQSWKCDVVKIDVEGNEEKVLKGMRETLKMNRDMRFLVEHTFGRYSPAYWDFLRTWFKGCYVCTEGGELRKVSKEEEAREASESAEFCMLYLEQ